MQSSYYLRLKFLLNYLYIFKKVTLWMLCSTAFLMWDWEKSCKRINKTGGFSEEFFFWEMASKARHQSWPAIIIIFVDGAAKLARANFPTNNTTSSGLIICLLIVPPQKTLFKHEYLLISCLYTCVTFIFFFFFFFFFFISDRFLIFAVFCDFSNLDWF